MSETYESGTAKAFASGPGNRDSSGDRQNGAGGSTTERLRGFANKQKNAGLEHMTGFASAAHKAADALEEKSSGVAGLVHEAADGLDRLSADLRERDVSEIYDSVHDFARRQPLVFVAGSFAAGMLLARFLKSSSANSSGQTEQPYHDSPSL